MYAFRKLHTHVYYPPKIQQYLVSRDPSTLCSETTPQLYVPPLCYPVYVTSSPRLDYLYAHPGAVPSLEGAANQINRLKTELGLEQVFLSSDAPVEGECSNPCLIRPRH